MSPVFEDMGINDASDQILERLRVPHVSRFWRHGKQRRF